MISDAMMYKNITLDDGRRGVVVDYLSDCLIVEVLDENNQWELLEVYFEDNEYRIFDDGNKVISLCARKEIRLMICKDGTYQFLLPEVVPGAEFNLTQKQYEDLCYLLEVDISNQQKGWNHFFEYNNISVFYNAIKMAATENGFYYVYGMNVEEKTADALYRCADGIFERYFPTEGIWREMPEQRMILKERKARYSVVTKEEGLALALLV